MGNLQIFVSPRSFLQVNHAQAEWIYRHLAETLGEGSASYAVDASAPAAAAPSAASDNLLGTAQSNPEDGANAPREMVLDLYSASLGSLHLAPGPPIVESRIRGAVRSAPCRPRPRGERGAVVVALWRSAAPSERMAKLSDLPIRPGPHPPARCRAGGGSDPALAPGASLRFVPAVLAHARSAAVGRSLRSRTSDTGRHDPAHPAHRIGLDPTPGLTAAPAIRAARPKRCPVTGRQPEFHRALTLDRGGGPG